MQKLLNWLKGLFLHPKEENTDMSEALNTTGTAVASNPVRQETAVADNATTAQAAAVADPATEAKAGVQDLDKALTLIEQGVALLGEAAKDDFVALAKKYL